MPSRKQGITAVEVMVSTLLASLLMVAMLSVLRGLKAQASALENRLPVPTWQSTLDAVLQADLENSRTYQITNNSVWLQGVDCTTWKPTTIVYEIVPAKDRSWLVRRDLARQQQELVLAGISAIRMGAYVDGSSVPNDNQGENPIVDGLTVECWGADPGGPKYGYRFRRP